MTEIPTYRDLMLPTLQAIEALGGSADKNEIDDKVIEQAGVTEDQLAVEYPPDATVSGPKILHRIAFARTYLKGIGALTNSQRGVWALTPEAVKYLAMQPDDAREALRVADNELRARWRKARVEASEENNVDEEDPTPGEYTWKEQLLAKLKTIDPFAFERLAMRLLREAGFRSVEVLGKSGDGGIDGVGVYKVSLVSFPTYFQCKRYAGSVSSGVVRDFRGAMTGRGEKGLIITTGTFTPSAKEEATRDGAPPIDLIGGDELCDLLKEYRLGVHVTERLVEDTSVDEAFFDQF